MSRDFSIAATRLVIFAKAPLAGRVKTRLIPALGREGAARLAHQLLLWTLQTAEQVPLVSKELCASPAPGHEAWQIYREQFPIGWSDQGEGDLGERLARAAQRVLNQGSSVLLVGTDCPLLTAEMIYDCAETLLHSDSVMIPARDGGYVLLGLRAFDPRIFEGIAWSTESVAAETRRRIRDLAWTLSEYPPLPDIDEEDDLRFLPKEFHSIVMSQS